MRSNKILIFLYCFIYLNWIYSLTKQKAPQVNLRRFLLPFVKIWVSKLKKERLLHYILKNSQLWTLYF
ncbi:hypothetical protein CH329_03205 [Mycoplasmopsis bovis]|nr:hypothetical protein CH329_03205 [Mycoplasmopsis bovis]